MRLLAVDVTDPDTGEVEAERVELTEIGNATRLVLDDGRILDFDKSEVRIEVIDRPKWGRHLVPIRGSGDAA